jgi:conflict system STAND superfamily ATPase
MGKTAAARMLGLVRLCQGWEVCECTDPDALWRGYRRDGRQMFIADDAFGSTEYRADAAERWALDLDRILQHLDDRHVLVWTSRPAPLHAALRRIHRENGLQRFPRPGEVMVDATDLSDEEKALMLFRHAVAAGLGADPRRVIRAEAANIVGDPYLTPERIRRLVAGRLASLEGDPAGAAEIAEGIAFEIGSPTEAMAASLAALDADHRDILVAMLDAPPGPVPERDLAATVRRHRHELAQPVAALVDRLQDHFLRRVPPTAVTWVHPSWRDLVIEGVGHDPIGRCAFLGRCGVEGALLALSVSGGSAGERHLPFLVEDADWDALLGHVDALVAGLDPADRVRLLRQVSEAVHDRRRVDDRRAAAELDALAGRLLERILPADLDAAGLVLLEEWYILAALAHAASATPDVARLWIELLPTTDLNLASPADVAALESWTALIGILGRYDPAALERFGVPAALGGLVGQLFAVDARVLAGKVSRDDAMTLGRVARSLAGVFPEQRPVLMVFSTDVYAFSRRAEEEEIEQRPRVFTDPPRPTVVSRVLADLDGPSPRRFLRRRAR